MSFYTYILQQWPPFRGLEAYYFLPVILILCGWIVIRRLQRGKLNLPPGPLGLPFVGYLPFLGEDPHKTLDGLRKKYGNVFSIYLGQTYVVVLGDYPAVKEAFGKPTTNNRPPKMFDFIPDGGGLSDANGEEWVEQRRFVVKSMKDIGLGRSRWARLVEDEVSDFIKYIASKEGRPLEIGEPLTDSVVNNITSLVFGERLISGPDRDLLSSGSNTVIEFFTQAGIWNFFPSLRDILVKLRIGSCYRSYKTMTSFNDTIKKHVDRHRNLELHHGVENFVTGYVAAMQTIREKEKGFSERNLVANTRVLYIAGSETTKTALVWLFLIMASYPDVQEKVQAELDRVLGEEQKALWEERSKFPYTYAVILESMRWQTTVPVNILRMASEDTKVCGYDIPKGATILANIWGVHNDSRYWTEPGKFIPERFLQNGGKEVNLKAESFIPFSYGKRKCIGETVAMMEAFLYFTAIMQVFDIRTPHGRKPKFAGYLGVTYQPKPQELCFIPRKKKKNENTE